MTQSSTRLHIVECDQCAATASVRGVPRRKALRLFRRAGWEVHSGALADMCPPCLRLDEKDPTR